MANLPAHSDNGDTHPDRGPTTGGPGWRTAVWVGLGVAVVVVFVVLHLTGVIGPETHG